MKNRNIASLACGFLIGLPLAVVAEDIEVYTGASLSAGARPNVVFIIDTSREMTYGPNQVQIHDTYDPNYTYAGNCERDQLYMVSSATKDTRFSESFRWDDDPDRDDDGCATTYPFYPVRLQAQDSWGGAVGAAVLETAATASCVAARTPLSTQGYYKDKMHWRRWEWIHPMGWGYRYYTGLNDGDMGVDPFWMQDYACEEDRDTVAATEEFFLFTGNYLNWYYNDRETRLDVAKRGIKKMIDALPSGGVNIGVMPFTENSLGARVLFPAIDIAGNQTAMKNAIDEMDSRPFTVNVGKRAVAGSMFEAYNYFSGNAPVIGEWNDPKSVPASKDGGRYNSPIDLACQTNHIVYISDGLPDENANPALRDFINMVPGFWDTVGSCDMALGGPCAVKLADFMQKKDVNPNVSGEQFVKTHAIGIGLDGSEAFFNDLTRAGNGEYIIADSADQLADAVEQLFESSIVINGTFVAPAVSVNAFNRSRHRDELFFAVFEVGQTPRWNGNIKKYQVRDTGSGFAIVDANLQPALDSVSGEFFGTARSWWSATPDGNDPVLGGGNSRLKETIDGGSRRALYTNVQPYRQLAVDDNLLSSSNAAITRSLTGAPDEATSDAWIDRFLNGAAKTKYGDPMHSRPVVVNYGGTDADPLAMIYFTTNDGMMHAVHAGNGSTADNGGGWERYGFMPLEMLKKIEKLGSSEIGPKAYGLDASVVPWVKDEGTLGTISGSDHVYLYFGAGRGGRFYYALDTTVYNDPHLLWSEPLTGGAGGAFNELGYTSADPVRAHIKLGGVARDVLVLSGGYDPNHENLPTSAADTMGRAIFIVDAVTGEHLWHGGPSGTGADNVFSDMTYAIPASVRVLDMDNDGYTDRMYAADLGGQVWRFDISNSAGSAAGLVKGGVIARLGLTAAESFSGMHVRKFYNTPDVALVTGDASGSYLSVSLGSGNRAHPVLDNDTNDMFFSLRDYDVYEVPDYSSYDVIELGDLTDVTADVDPVIPANSDGWYLRMSAKEKVLAESRTFDNQLIFTTYQPDSAVSPDACKPNLGIGHVYTVSVRDASPSIDRDDDGMEPEDRSSRLARSGIPPEVVILFPDSADGEPLAFVGPESTELPESNTRYRTYWTDQEDDE